MATFKIALRQLRKRYVGKQLSLAASLGCTESAVSFWEHGRRLPLRQVQARIIDCLRAAGAKPGEIEELQNAYDDGRG